MKNTISYEFLENSRATNEWIGASVRKMASLPRLASFPNPISSLIEAWGTVTERTFSRMTLKPEWDIDIVQDHEGIERKVEVKTVLERPFGDLVYFSVAGRKPLKRRILLIAPMSGHYASLLRTTVESLLPDNEVYITDWRNARDIPLSHGTFDVEDYTLYLVDFIKHLGPDINVVAVCQPVPLALVATAYLSKNDKANVPKTLTLIGGPVNPDANPSEVTCFADNINISQLRDMMVYKVGAQYQGADRPVYPGLIQLQGFISMNGGRHYQAFTDQVLHVAQGEENNADRHNSFYDEYLAVMDMTAEFYLSTVDRIFKKRQIAQNDFTIQGHKVDITAIEKTAVFIVEGEEDDISSPGQCHAALDLLPKLPSHMKRDHLQEGAGHYGIFAGKAWRNNIRPKILKFIDEFSQENAPQQANKKTKPS